MILSMLFLNPRRWRSKHRCFETLQPSCAKRTKPSSKSDPSPKHQRLVNTLAAMLTGHGDGGDGDLFADDEEEAEPSSVFRSAPLSAPVTASALAFRRPGEVFAAGMK